MATRRERVILDLEDNFSGGMARAAAAAALLNKQLEGSNRRFDTSTKRANALNSSFEKLHGNASAIGKDLDGLAARSLPAMGRQSESTGRQIDRLSGRLALFAQAAAVLGPALVPIGAAAIPAISGLTLQLGLAAAAAGVAVLAFQGVGDGLKALDTYQLKPTAENFEKLSQAMDKLGPAGGEFVLFLDKIQPQLKGIRDLAAQGLLPGVQEGLTPLLTQLPKLREVVFTISTTLGDLSASAGKNLAGPEFRDFFNYLNTTAKPVLTEMGQTFGNVFAGIGNALMAFDPLSRGFSEGLLNWSEGFKNATANLDSNQGFQDFVTYVQQNGPKAIDALGSLGNALLQLVEAAAPIGSAILPVITQMADAFSALANSGVGPALIATAAGVSVLSRSMALLGVETKGLKATGLTGGGLANIFGVGKIGKGLDAFTTVTTGAERAQLSVAKLAEVEEKRAATARAGAAQFGKSAALIGGLALATSGLADKTGLSNTASLALMGTIAGPFGAAIGAGTGFVMDMAAANNDLETAVKASDRALQSSSTGFVAQSQSLKQAQAAYAEYSHAVDRGNANAFTDGLSSPGEAFKAISDKFTHSREETKRAIDAQLRDFQQLKDGTKAVFQGMTGHEFTGTTQQLTDFANKITPALQRAGISVKEFQRAAATGMDPGLLLRGMQAIQGYFASFDSATGKSKAVAAALAEMGNQMDTNVNQAEALKAAMDSLFGVQMTQSAATDAWTQNLRSLKEQIAATNGAIRGTSTAALSNREAIRGSVQALQDKINADAAAGVSGDKLVGSLIKGRNAIIQQAVAAGASRKSVAAYLRTLGLTPKNLTTIIQADGALSAKQKVQALAKVYGLTPKQLTTVVKEIGSGASRAKVRAMLATYGLTPRQITTLLRAIDKASAVAKRAQAAIDRMHGKTVELRAQNMAGAAVAAAQGIINSLHGKSVTVTTFHRSVGAIKGPDERANGGVYVNGIRTFADGGYGADGRYYSRTPQVVKGGAGILWGEMETGKEAYISKKPGMEARNLQVLSEAAGWFGAQVVQQYANGGTRSSSPSAPVAVGDPGLAREIRALRKEVAGLGDRVERGASAGTARGVQGAARGSSARGRSTR